MLKYQKIASEIEMKITKLNLSQGSKLPNTKTLSQEYNVGRNTIIKALELLESRGLIYQVQGSGTFVRQKSRKGYITLLANHGYTENLSYFDLKSKVISFNMINAPKNVAANLRCTMKDKVYKVERVHFVHDQILCLEETYYKVSTIPFLNNEIVGGAIYKYIEDILNIEVGYSDKYLIVKKVDDHTSEYLQLPKDSPMLLIEEIYYTKNGDPFNFSKNYYHYEHSQFFLQS